MFGWLNANGSVLILLAGTLCSFLFKLFTQNGNDYLATSEEDVPACQGDTLH